MDADIETELARTKELFRRQEAARLLANELLLVDFALRADGDKLYVTPSARLTDVQASAVRGLKPELLALLKRSCPKCRRQFDEKGCCWQCFTRPCWVCGRDTGSCFIASCLRCGIMLED